ncbi:MAG TPA: ABC transporter permease subunit [Negativicutes bacterium]|jgi:putative spermidine/putrescine transport system permease protein
MFTNKFSWSGLVLGAILFYLFVPLAATFLFSIAQEWQTTILPGSYTLAWYERLFQDPIFFKSLGRSLTISLTATVLGMLIIIPAVLVTLFYYPKMETILRFFSNLPFAFPPVILAVGLIELYGHKPIVLTGTIWILLGSYFVLLLPYMYQATSNSFRAIDAVSLVAAAENLGANRLQAFIYVILPNILPGLLVAFLLSFSILFGEFVLANLLVGSGYQTLQLYLYKVSWENGHLASAIVVVYYVFILFITMAILVLQQSETKRKTRTLPG